MGGIAERETGDTRARPVSDYGCTEGDELKPVLVDSQGRLIISDEGGLSSSTTYDGDTFTVGTTAVEVTFTISPKSIQIEADVENSGFIYVGASNVLEDGSNSAAKLEPGARLSADYDNTTNAIYVISDTAGQTVRKFAVA